MNGLIYEQTNWQGNMGHGRNFADITWIALALVLLLVHKKRKFTTIVNLLLDSATFSND